MGTLHQIDVGAIKKAVLRVVPPVAAPAPVRPIPRPCPFCSSEADAGRIGLTSRYGVTCSNDDCPVEVQATAGSLAEAVAAWNGVAK